MSKIYHSDGKTITINEELEQKNSDYTAFYDKRNELKYSKDAYYLAVIEDIEKSIEELKEYCLQHPNEIKGNRKSR